MQAGTRGRARAGLDTESKARWVRVGVQDLLTRKDTRRFLGLSCAPKDVRIGIALRQEPGRVCVSIRAHAREKKLCTYRGTSPIRKRPPPEDPPRTLGIGLR